MRQTKVCNNIVTVRCQVCQYFTCEMCHMRISCLGVLEIEELYITGLCHCFYLLDYKQTK